MLHAAFGSTKWLINAAHTGHGPFALIILSSNKAAQHSLYRGRHDALMQGEAKADLGHMAAASGSFWGWPDLWGFGSPEVPGGCRSRRFFTA